MKKNFTWLLNLNFQDFDRGSKEEVRPRLRKQHSYVTCRIRVRDWNEEELKVYFIALLLDMIDFYDTDFRPFMKREMSVEYADNKKLWGVVDFFVAQGKHSPKEPFFFIHEYKKQLDTSNVHLGNYWRKWSQHKL